MIPIVNSFINFQLMIILIGFLLFMVKQKEIIMLGKIVANLAEIFEHKGIIDDFKWVQYIP